MKVKFTESFAGDRFEYHPGQVYELSEKQARPYIRAGFAVVVEGGETEQSGEVEVKAPKVKQPKGEKPTADKKSGRPKKPKPLAE